MSILPGGTMTITNIGLDGRPERGSGEPLGAQERLDVVIQWINDFVARPHEDLGRVGDVCPYMERAMRRKVADFHLFDGSTGDEALVSQVRELREALLEKAKSIDGDPVYLTTVIIPYGKEDDELADMLDRVHGILKPEFVERGLMLGEFWPGHVGQGLHNDQFRPLASPVPLVALRHMVLTDLWFLTLPGVEPEQQVEFLRHYRRVFDGQLSGRWQANVEAAEAAALESIAQPKEVR
jgi:hypothetical protein